MSMNNGDTHTPHADGKWHFDQSVTDNFDAMIRASIPGYESMRDSIVGLIRRYTANIWEHRVRYVDWGASRGHMADLILPLMNRVKHSYACIEVSDPMVDVLNKKFSNTECVSIHKADMRSLANQKLFPNPFFSDKYNIEADIHLLVLTLQFVPTEYRSRILKAIFKATRPGGFLIFVEKVTSDNAWTQGLFVDTYHDHKFNAGYSQEEIKTKRLSLENSLVALSEESNVNLMRSAGYTHVECFWRNLNFAGWIAYKE